MSTVTTLWLGMYLPMYMHTSAGRVYRWCYSCGCVSHPQEAVPKVTLIFSASNDRNKKKIPTQHLQTPLINLQTNTNATLAYLPSQSTRQTQFGRAALRHLTRLTDNKRAASSFIHPPPANKAPIHHRNTLHHNTLHHHHHNHHRQQATPLLPLNYNRHETPAAAAVANMSLNPDNLMSLKVTELRAELKKRSLTATGLKPVLVARLREFLLQEAANTPEEPEADDEDAEGELESVTIGVKEPSGEKAVEEKPQEPEPTEKKAKELEEKEKEVEEKVQEVEKKVKEVEEKVQEVDKKTQEVVEKLQGAGEKARQIEEKDQKVAAPVEETKADPGTADASTPTPKASPAKDAPKETVTAIEETTQVEAPPPAIEDAAEPMQDVSYEKPAPVHDTEPAAEAPAPSTLDAPPAPLPETSSQGEAPVQQDAPVQAEDLDAEMEAPTVVQEATLDTHATITQEAALPVQASDDISPETVVIEQMDLDPIDTLKRKRRSASPPPSLLPEPEPKAEAETTPPSAKKQRAESPPRRGRDARFKGLFNDSAPVEQERGPIDNEDDESPMEPSIHPATRALYIRNLVRPLQEHNLRAHILSLASRNAEDPSENLIETFYLDSIKSHALIVFESQTAANRVRVGIHNKIFPVEKSRKPLWADFVPEESVPRWIEREKTRGGRWEVVYETVDGEVTAELVEAGSGATGGRMAGRMSNVSVGVGAGVGRARGNVDISSAPSGPRRGTEGMFSARDAVRITRD